MKLCKLIIKDFQQFKDLNLDLTYPSEHAKANEPLDKFCLIGRNGTGKSTLINFLYGYLSKIPSYRSLPLLIVKLKIEDIFIYTVSSNKFGQVLCYKEEVEKKENWIDCLNNNKTIEELDSYRIPLMDLVEKLTFRHNANDLIIYSPSEGTQNLSRQVHDVPQAQLNDALKLFDNFPYNHSVTTDSINTFWKLLIYLVKKRENDLREFENKEENLDKTIRQVKQEFEKSHPVILEKIGELWNKILGKAGLEFDVENASNPVQLNENLKAYIKLSKSNQRINYGQLSTGIRNFIFRVGHIYSLYFEREIDKGFLLLDEPENSLFPDFLYDLVENYFDLTINTQLIIATHSPIIAAQFEPCERVILEFDDDGYVISRKGVTPAGDDPNDLLMKDFGISSLLGKEGIKKWERYIELKVLIPKEKDPSRKKEMIAEFMSIGNSYNFDE